MLPIAGRYSRIKFLAWQWQTSTHVASGDRGPRNRKDVELRAPSATVTLLGDRHVYAPYGVFGGHPGACAETLLVRDGETEPLGSKDMVELRHGDVLSFRLAGAGGATGIRRNATVKRCGAIWRMDSCRRTRRVWCTGSNWMEATEGYDAADVGYAAWCVQGPSLATDAGLGRRTVQGTHSASCWSRFNTTC